MAELRTQKKFQTLRSKENEKFLAFFELIQEEARKASCVFFLDCGQGNEFETETMEGEDVSGWLVPFDMADAFEKDYISHASLEQWDDTYTWAEWEDRHKPKIKLVSYEN